MRPALEELNANWSADPSRIEMKIGIGVNFGEVVVGEIGSPDRREFTVLGDAVNTAARFESATKQYHVDILIGGSIEALTRGKFVYRCVDLSRFKGKKKPVETFTPLSSGDTPPPPWLESYHHAIRLYRSRQWASARGLFESVHQALGGEDFLCEMYLKRIALHELNPPSADWEGAHTLEEK
jgi:adenylate cyclase